MPKIKAPKPKTLTIKNQPIRMIGMWRGKELYGTPKTKKAIKEYKHDITTLMEMLKVTKEKHDKTETNLLNQLDKLHRDTKHYQVLLIALSLALALVIIL